MRIFLSLFATMSASALLMGTVSAQTSLVIPGRICAASIAGAACDDNQARDEHFRTLELITIRELDRNIENDPNNSLLYLRKGFVLSEMGDVLQALAAYNRAIGLNPRDPQAYFYRGNLRFETGDANLALQDYSRALSLNPHLREVYTARAVVRAELGDEDGAIADFDQARRLTHEPQPRPTAPMLIGPR